MADPKPHLFTCPGCGFYGPGEAFSGDDDNKGYAHLLGEIGNRELAHQVEHYLGLFRPPQRRITAPRARKLLGELVPMIKAGVITRDGREWLAPPAVWISGIVEMLRLRDARKLDLPMESHGYLLDVMTTLANRAERQAETQHEQLRRDDSQARGAHTGREAQGIGDLAQGLPVRRVQTGPDGIALAPGQRPGETQAQFFARRRGE